MSLDDQVRELRSRLNQAHPLVGLTFGYTGNIYRGDDSSLRWQFFTNVPRPGERGCFGWPRYGVPKAERATMMQLALSGKLEEWLVAEVLPHQANAWRSYVLSGQGVALWPWPWLKERGASYGSFGQNRIMFGIQGFGLEQLRERFPGFRWEAELVY
jgi:hypothetical protein